jgi:cysteine synthase
MDILAHVGETPIIQLKRSSPNPDVQIWAKLELCNPTGSLKDRIALFMLEQAEKRGELKPGMTIIEATSGNTGISLGMAATVKGYKLKLFMLESKTIERRKMLRFWGSELVLTTKDDPDSHIYGAQRSSSPPSRTSTSTSTRTRTKTMSWPMSRERGARSPPSSTAVSMPLSPALAPVAR